MIPASRVKHDLLSHCVFLMYQQVTALQVGQWYSTLASAAEIWEQNCSLSHWWSGLAHTVGSFLWACCYKSEYPTFHCWEESGNREAWEDNTQVHCSMDYSYSIFALSPQISPEYLYPLWEKLPSLMGWHCKRCIAGLETTVSQTESVWYSMIIWSHQNVFERKKFALQGLNWLVKAFQNSLSSSALLQAQLEAEILHLKLCFVFQIICHRLGSLA